MISRRRFLAVSSTFAAELFAGASQTPDERLERLGAVALAEAKRLKASYCDIRINRYREQNTGVRLSVNRATGRTLESPFLADSTSFGFGVRVIVSGAWGFAASPLVTAEEIRQVTRQAVEVARANAALRGRPVVLAPVKAFRDRWHSPMEKDPFEVPAGEKLELLRAAAHEAKAHALIQSAVGVISLHSEEKYFASSEGSSIQQRIVQVYPALTASAVDAKAGIARSRSYTPPPLCAGYELLHQYDFRENARRIREEVLEHLAAPPVKPGRKDLVLLPSHLFLTIHESIGHSTELDRALGYEANFAGTSFLTPDKLGKERVGSPRVSFYGDRTTPQALATVAYDDDGVPARRFLIIQKGIFVGYQTTRDQAHLVGEQESRGCCYADSWSSVPFQRMPNVSLEPGPAEVTLEDLIAGIEDGILIDGRGSYSIDQQRYNFQFGGDAFWEIRGGKKRGMISRVAYQSRTPDFWQACDGIAGPAYWALHGSTRDGKGEPMQINAMSHGCSPARFRGIQVLLTD